ncbi:hypothetical protein [Spiroplasma endosymbiont of Polydrusus cervinus]|uniref:hypothetical protein n=1 Tax=Spiroplasma endosymbiont of Polydrusus cervinus TaxID=3066287 RepID=UPI0030D53AC0
MFSSYFEFYGGNNPIINYWKEVYANDKVFNQVDNKWYFAVWRGIYKNNITNWRIIKFKHNELKNKTVDSYDTYKLNLIWIWYPFSWWYDIGIETKQGGFSAWWFETYPNIKSVYRWDGDGEPNTPEIDFKTVKITDWNLKNQNNIINNNDEIKVTVKNKDISENPIYQLESNYFNWLSMTNELETNNISSLIPAEIKLSDGEYGKYLTNLIVSNYKIKKLLNLFSTIKNSLYSKLKWINLINHVNENFVKLSFLQSINILNQIEISAIWGYGNYDINIFIEKPNEKIIAGKDINLELIKSCPIGTKVSGVKDRNTYLILIEDDIWYLYKNGIEDEKSYSNKAVADFLKQSNSVIFSYLPKKEQIEINNLKLFNKNNEKLSLITLEI